MNMGIYGVGVWLSVSAYKGSRWDWVNKKGCVCVCVCVFVKERESEQKMKVGRRKNTEYNWGGKCEP